MIYVLGIGNVLMGDDGFGPAVVRAFADGYDAGPDVSVVDIGTPGLDLTPWLADADRVVIVDTVNATLPPGTVRVYGSDVLRRHVANPRIGPHDPGVKEALLALEFAGRAPAEVMLVGVVPESTAMSLTLSPSVASATSEALAAIVTVLSGWGVAVTRRETTVPPSSWWVALSPLADADGA